MSYIVSHHESYEPCGGHNNPDKEFESYDKARDYYNSLYAKYKAKADEHIKAFPKLYSEQHMKDDLWQELTGEMLDEWELAGFVFHENYTYHAIMLEEF